MDVFVARQPIFNRTNKVYAYELLFRSGLQNFYQCDDPEHATSQVINNSFFVIGLDAITGGKKAFVNFSQGFLENDFITILSSDKLVIEILENVKPEISTIEACKRLKKAGYMLVLDDFVLHPDMQIFLELADIVKIDFLSTQREIRRGLPEKLKPYGVQLLAEKIETQEDFKEALQAGYVYFQGYYFSKPVILQGKDIPTYKLNYLQLLHKVNEPNPNLSDIEIIIKRDVALSYKLLRTINSAIFGLRQEVTSIMHALTLLGLNDLVKWVALMAMHSMGNDKPEELVISSLIRARLGELLISRTRLPERSGDAFLTGLFSMIDAFMDRPRESTIRELPISEDIKAALLDNKGPLAPVYNLVIAYEKGNWQELARLAETLGIHEEEVAQQYLQAVQWTHEVLAIT